MRSLTTLQPLGHAARGASLLALETKAPTGYQWSFPMCQGVSVHTGISSRHFELYFLHKRLAGQ